MFGQNRRPRERGAWIIAVAGTVMVCSTSMAQMKGGGGDDSKGPARQAPPPAARPAPRMDAPRPSAPAPSIKQAPPPVIRQAPPPVSRPPVIQAPKPQMPVAKPAPQPAPRADVKPAPTPIVRPPVAQPPVAQPPAAKPPVLQAPPKQPPVFQAPPKQPPVFQMPPKQVPQGPTRPQMNTPAAPLPAPKPWSGGTKFNTRGDDDRTPIIKAAPPSASGPKPTPDIKPQGPTIRPDTPWTKGGGPTKANTGGIRPKPWGEVKPDSPIAETTPVKPVTPVTPLRTRRDDFQKPLPPTRGDDSSIFGGGRFEGTGTRTNRVPEAPVGPDRRDRGGRSGLSVGVGISFSGYANFDHGSVNFAFRHGYRPYHPYGHGGWHHRRHWDPYWGCNPWGGFYYVSCWPYYPFTWWYPGYTVSVHSCGPWYRVAYHRPLCSWLIDFSYCGTPCDTFSECSLISPAVVVETYTPPTYCWSATNTYRYAYVNTISAEPEQTLIVASDGLPLPASPAELAGTSERELGDTYFKLGDTDSAIRVYQAHISRHPGDVVALRSLGVALIEAGQTASGFEAVERAYRIDPTLAQRLFERELLRDPAGFSAVLDRATAAAGGLDGKPEAKGAWLTVAMLMQADGRGGPARTALDKAKDAGLSAKVVEFMQAALPVD